MAVNATEAPFVTKEQYLEQERKAKTKSEYRGGVVVAIAGANTTHNVISSNFHGELYIQLKASKFQIFGSDMRVTVPKCHRYYYPDLSVSCQDAEFEDEVNDILSTPTLIVEILSASTAEYDRGEKWHCYQTLPSLQICVFVSQAAPCIEVYQRIDSGWLYQKFSESESQIPLPPLGCQIALKEIYRRVTFAQNPENPLL